MSEIMTENRTVLDGVEPFFLGRIGRGGSSSPLETLPFRYQFLLYHRNSHRGEQANQDRVNNKIVTCRGMQVGPSQAAGWSPYRRRNGELSECLERTLSSNLSRRQTISIRELFARSQITYILTRFSVDCEVLELSSRVSSANFEPFSTVALP